MIFTTITTAILSRIVEGEVKDKQKSEIKQHTEKGFKPGVRVRAFQGPQKNRQLVIEEVRHLWLIGRDDEGDLFRLLVINCQLVNKPNTTPNE